MKSFKIDANLFANVNQYYSKLLPVTKQTEEKTVFDKHINCRCEGQWVFCAFMIGFDVTTDTK